MDRIVTLTKQEDDVSGAGRKVPPVLITAFMGYAFFLLLFCTKNSPLFPATDYHDANVYFTMGKGMMNGYVPYVDLIDNKGPLLYLIYGLAWCINDKGFIGVYIVQSLLLGASILYTYKLIRLFVKSVTASVLAALISPMMMLTMRLYANANNFGGGSPDELCRAFIIIALYYFTLFFLKPEEYVPVHTAVLGVLMACVFLLKFNYIIFWFGFLLIIAIQLCRQKVFSELFLHIGLFLLGSVVCIAPFIVYLVWAGGLQAFFREYFFYNIIYAQSISPVVDSLSLLFKPLMGLGGFIYFIGFSVILSLTFIAGCVFVFRRTEKWYRKGYFLSLILTLVTVYMSRVFPFTSIPVTAFCVVGLIPAAELIELALQKVTNRRTAIAVLAGCMIFLYTVSDNNLMEYLVTIRENGLTNPRTGVSEVIKNDGLENPSVLELASLDSGFYTACDVFPPTPYFYQPNIDYKDYPKVLDAQYELIAGKDVDYAVITLVNQQLLNVFYSDEERNIKLKMLETLRDNYELVGVFNATGFLEYRQYNLYRVKR